MLNKKLNEMWENNGGFVDYQGTDQDLKDFMMDHLGEVHNYDYQVIESTEDDSLKLFRVYIVQENPLVKTNPHKVFLPPENPSMKAYLMLKLLNLKRQRKTPKNPIKSNWAGSMYLNKGMGGYVKS